MARSSLPSSLVLLWILGAAVPTVWAGGNQLTDTDGDGAMDYAFVADWDGDGTLEMEDIQAAVEALDDPGPKHVVIAPGNFEPPAVGFSYQGILTLPGNLVLEGAGVGATILNGFVSTDVFSRQAVISNGDHWGGNDGITVRNLEIDGGWRDGDSSAMSAGMARMGVFWNRCNDCLVENLYIHNTAHACLYAKNGVNVTFQNNTVDRCGNYEGTGPRYPCIYLYADAGSTASSISVIQNNADRCGGAGLATRRQNTQATLRQVLFSDNTVSNTKIQDGNSKRCINIRGVDDVTYLNTLCTHTGGVFTYASDSYYSEGLNADAVANLLIDNLEINNLGPGNNGLEILPYLENAEFRNVTVDGTPGTDCVQFETPLRNVRFDGLELSGCGRRGIAESVAGPPAAVDEGLTFRNVTIQNVDTDPDDGVDWPALQFLGPTRYLSLEQWSIDAVAGSGIRFNDELSEATLDRITISDVGASGVLFWGGSTGVTMQDLTVSGAEQGINLRPRAVPNGADHSGLTIRTSTLTGLRRSGIKVAPGATMLSNVLIHDLVVDGSGESAVDLVLDASRTSDAITIRDSTLRNFGQQSPGGPQARGVNITGSADDVVVRDNLLDGAAGIAESGVYFNVQPLPADLSLLCTNSCTGGPGSAPCLNVPGTTGFGLDQDDDGFVDACDNCPAIPGLDLDGDAVCGEADNCPDIFNSLQSDFDGDAVGNPCDNCPGDSNTGQSNFDQDLLGDRCDLDDGLIYVWSEGSSGVAWQAEEGLSAWNLYRGDLGELLSSGTYTQLPGSNPLASRWCAIDATSFEDPTVPAAGAAAFYLVTGESPGGESGLGPDGSGTVRVDHNPCP